MSFALTAPYAALLTLIYITLTQLVIRIRLKENVSLGDANAAVLPAVRRQGNFVENVPLALLLMALAEAGGSSPLLLNACGLVLVIARLIHPFGINIDRQSHPARIIGAAATSGVQLVLAITLLVHHFA